MSSRSSLEKHLELDVRKINIQHAFREHSKDFIGADSNPFTERAGAITTEPVLPDWKRNIDRFGSVLKLLDHPRKPNVDFNLFASAVQEPHGKSSLLDGTG